MKLQYIYFSLLVLALVLFLLPIVPAAAVPVTETWSQTDFWFRDDDGTEASATGYGFPDTGEDTNISGVAPKTSFRLRFGIKVTGVAGTIVPVLEFKEGTDCAAGSWTAITPTSDAFSLRLSGNFSDGDSTTKQIAKGSFVAGQILESTNPASSLDLPKNKNTEYEWSLQVADNVVTGAIYGFRITNNGTALNNYEQCPSLTTQPIPGGMRTVMVSFSGKAFPGATILAIDKDVKFVDSVVGQDIVTNENGVFQVNFFGILQGQHSFGLVIKDEEGRPTQTKFFNIGTSANDLAVKDIFIPPTVGLPERTVTKGRNAIITGYASPNSDVILEIDDTIKKEAKAKEDGLYKAAVDTGELEFGTHYVRVKQVDASQKRESDYSPTSAFLVSHLTLPKTDLSGDGIVNIKDWSMFLSRWSSKDESQKKLIDLNDDGKVDIADFSIFIHAIKK